MNGSNNAVAIGFGIFFAIGIICYTIMLFVTIISMPIYIIISYILWNLTIVALIVAKKKGSWKGYIAVITFLTFIFICIFAPEAMYYGFFEDEIVMAIGGPIFHVPVPCIIGYFIRLWYVGFIDNKTNRLRNAVRKMLDSKISIVTRLKATLNECNLTDIKTSHLVCLIDSCTIDSHLKSVYENTNESLYAIHIKKLEGIIPNEDLPQNKQQLDLYVKQHLCKNEEYKRVLKNLSNYDYITLKKLYNQYQ